MRKRKTSQIRAIRQNSAGNFFALGSDLDTLAQMEKEDARLLSDSQIDTKAAAQETLAWIEGEGVTEQPKAHQSNEPTDALEMLREIFN